MKIMKYIVPALLGGMLTLQSCEHFSVYCRCIRTTHIS